MVNYLGTARSMTRCWCPMMVVLLPGRGFVDVGVLMRRRKGGGRASRYLVQPHGPRRVIDQEDELTGVGGNRMEGMVFHLLASWMH